MAGEEEVDFMSVDGHTEVELTLTEQIKKDEFSVSDYITDIIEMFSRSGIEGSHVSDFTAYALSSDHIHSFDELVNEAQTKIKELLKSGVLKKPNKGFNTLFSSGSDKSDANDSIDKKVREESIEDAINERQKDLEKDVNEDYFLFYPSKRDMRLDYPELSDIKEFASLSNKEIVFVWYFSNPTSPYISIDEKTRVVLSMKEAYGHQVKMELVDQYVEGFIPESVRIAIDRMKRFNPSFRMRAKLMQEKIFSDYQKIIAKNVSRMTPEEWKSHVSICKSIQEQLPNLISSIEVSFGIKESSSSSRNGKMNEMDIILSQENLTNEFI